MIGCVGNDFLGQLLTDNLHQANVRVEAIIENQNHTIGGAFITADNTGQNTIIVASGTNNPLSSDALARLYPRPGGYPDPKRK